MLKKGKKNFFATTVVATCCIERAVEVFFKYERNTFCIPP